jgi:hypothetical protein
MDFLERLHEYIKFYEFSTFIWEQGHMAWICEDFHSHRPNAFERVYTKKKAIAQI